MRKSPGELKNTDSFQERTSVAPSATDLEELDRMMNGLAADLATAIISGNPEDGSTLQRGVDAAKRAADMVGPSSTEQAYSYGMRAPPYSKRRFLAQKHGSFAAYRDSLSYSERRLRPFHMEEVTSAPAQQTMGPQVFAAFGTSATENVRTIGEPTMPSQSTKPKVEENHGLDRMEQRLARLEKEF